MSITTNKDVQFEVNVLKEHISWLTNILEQGENSNSYTLEKMQGYARDLAAANLYLNDLQNDKTRAFLYSKAVAGTAGFPDKNAPSVSLDMPAKDKTHVYYSYYINQNYNEAQINQELENVVENTNINFLTQDRLEEIEVIERYLDDFQLLQNKANSENEYMDYENRVVQLYAYLDNLKNNPAITQSQQKTLKTLIYKDAEKSAETLKKLNPNVANEIENRFLERLDDAYPIIDQTQEIQEEAQPEQQEVVEQNQTQEETIQKPKPWQILDNENLNPKPSTPPQQESQPKKKPWQILDEENLNKRTKQQTKVEEKHVEAEKVNEEETVQTLNDSNKPELSQEEINQKASKYNSQKNLEIALIDQYIEKFGYRLEHNYYTNEAAEKNAAEIVARLNFYKEDLQNDNASFLFHKSQEAIMNDDLYVHASPKERNNEIMRNYFKRLAAEYPVKEIQQEPAKPTPQQAFEELQKKFADVSPTITPPTQENIDDDPYIFQQEPEKHDKPEEQNQQPEPEHDQQPEEVAQPDPEQEPENIAPEEEIQEEKATEPEAVQEQTPAAPPKKETNFWKNRFKDLTHFSISIIGGPVLVVISIILAMSGVGALVAGPLCALGLANFSIAPVIIDKIDEIVNSAKELPDKKSRKQRKAEKKARQIKNIKRNMNIQEQYNFAQEQSDFAPQQPRDGAAANVHAEEKLLAEKKEKVSRKQKKEKKSKIEAEKEDLKNQLSDHSTPAPYFYKENENGYTPIKDMKSSGVSMDENLSPEELARQQAIIDKNFGPNPEKLDSSKLNNNPIPKDIPSFHYTSQEQAGNMHIHEEQPMYGDREASKKDAIIKIIESKNKDQGREM